MPLSDSRATYIYEGGYHGSGPDADSRDEALRTMAMVPGAGTTQFAWSERTAGRFDVPLT